MLFLKSSPYALCIEQQNYKKLHRQSEPRVAPDFNPASFSPSIAAY
jgi:hypothetical protein